MNKRSVSRTCCVCDYQFPAAVFSVHLSSHHEDTTLPFSSDMKDACRTVCRICDREMVLTRLRGHTKDKHDLSITDYKIKFNLQVLEVTEKVFHKCALCSEIMLLDSDAIAQHLHKHSISHRTYNDKHMNMAVQRKGTLEEPEKQSPSGFFGRSRRSKPEISNEDSNDVIEVIDVPKNNRRSDKSGKKFPNPGQKSGKKFPNPGQKSGKKFPNPGHVTKPKSELENISQKPKPIQKGQRSRRFLSHYDMHLIAWPHECGEVY